MGARRVSELLIDNRIAVFATAVIAQWGTAFVGDSFRRRLRPLRKDEREDFDTVLAATLTLLVHITAPASAMYRLTG